MREAEHPARRTVRTPRAQALARFGYACKGIVYLAMGALVQGHQAINGRFMVHPSSVKVGIEFAGIGVIFVEEEGDTAMTKPRDPTHTVAFVDDYCAHYRAVFPNVRQVEQFTRLELGLVAETKRKSLPRLAQATKADPQALHHFLAKADWSIEALRAVRLELTRQALRERPFILCIDETR